MEEYVFIVRRGTPVGEIQPLRRVPISDSYEAWYFDASRLPPISIRNYSYTAIPNLYALCDTDSLEQTGIYQLQIQEGINLRGLGVLVAFIDSGIDGENPLFIGEDGRSRIVECWDQNTDVYGDVLAVRDENGHGTFLASITAGEALPLSDILVVKLRPAPKYLKDYFYVPSSFRGETNVIYAENDIMAGIYYAKQKAIERNQPLVVCLGIGTNMGSHDGIGPLCFLVNEVSATRHQAITVPVGNEGISNHHYFGRVESLLQPQRVEFQVEENQNGLYFEFWCREPERYLIQIQSPTGEVSTRGTGAANEHLEYTYLFEGTSLTIDYRDVGVLEKNTLVAIRLSNVVRGIWSILVQPLYTILETFHIWLPMSEMSKGNVFFLRPNPDTTLTSPGDAKGAITIGGYRGDSGATFFQTGRGFRPDGEVKPDLIAPSVDVQGAGLRQNVVEKTGTSIGAGLAAGACGQILEWAVVRQNALDISGIDIKSLLIRGARRSEGKIYPDKVEGYGKLDAFHAFEMLRK